MQSQETPLLVNPPLSLSFMLNPSFFRLPELNIFKPCQIKSKIEVSLSILGTNAIILWMPSDSRLSHSSDMCRKYSVSLQTYDIASD